MGSCCWNNDCTAAAADRPSGLPRSTASTKLSRLRRRRCVCPGYSGCSACQVSRGCDRPSWWSQANTLALLLRPATLAGASFTISNLPKALARHQRTQAVGKMYYFLRSHSG